MCQHLLEHWSTENIESEATETTLQVQILTPLTASTSELFPPVYVIKKYTALITCGHGRLLDCPPITTTRGKSKVACTLDLMTNKANTNLQHSRRIHTQGQSMLWKGRLSPCIVWHSQKNGCSLQRHPRNYPLSYTALSKSWNNEENLLINSNYLNIGKSTRYIMYRYSSLVEHLFDRPENNHLWNENRSMVILNGRWKKSLRVK